MSGSSKNEQDKQVDSSTEHAGAGGANLASFLAPAKPRSSVIPPAESAAAEAARTAKITEKTDDEDRRTSQAPPSESATGSLIPVARTAEEIEELDEQAYDELPESPPITSVRLRRVTVTALLAAAAAVPLWLMMRTPQIGASANATAVAIQQAPAVQALAPTGIDPASLLEEADDDKDLDVDPPAPIDPAKGLKLRQEARRLLENGQIEQGVAKARNAIEANPADPECYVLLAAGLQDMGRWAESREVFSKCVHKSEKGVNAECAYFATSNTITNR